MLAGHSILLVLACTRNALHTRATMVRIQPGIVDVLKEPDLLADMHVIAERRHTPYVVNHVLIRQLALRAFGLEGEAYASLGVGVQEILSDFIERERTVQRVLGRYNTALLLDAPEERVVDVVLDVAEGFRTTEPEVFRTVYGIVSSHLEVPSSQNLAMFGAALSHSMSPTYTLED